MIREANSNDIKSIISLIDEFIQEGLGEHGMSFEKTSLIKTIQYFIDSHIFLVIDDNGIKGCIGGIVSPSIFNYDEIIAEERIWFVTKSYRGTASSLRLLKEFERKCKDVGVKFILMVHLSNVMPGKVKDLYRLNNYKEVETHYIKAT